MTMIEDYGIYEETCSMYRDFETTYSEISLKAGAPYKLNIGYKVYNNYLDKQPDKKGHKLGLEWIMRGDFELAVGQLSMSALAIMGSTTALCLF